jgi:hypothetical protein
MALFSLSFYVMFMFPLAGLYEENDEKVEYELVVCVSQRSI